TPRRRGANLWRRYDREILRRSGDPIEKWLPHRLRLLLIEALEDHRNHDIAVADEDLLAPMRVEERLCVEFEGFGDQAAVGVVGRRLYGLEDPAEKRGQRVRAQGDASDD